LLKWLAHLWKKKKSSPEFPSRKEETWNLFLTISTVQVSPLAFHYISWSILRLSFRYKYNLPSFLLKTQAKVLAKDARTNVAGGLKWTLALLLLLRYSSSPINNGASRVSFAKAIIGREGERERSSLADRWVWRCAAVAMAAGPSSRATCSAITKEREENQSQEAERAGRHPPGQQNTWYFVMAFKSCI
jgi:hypothetical protein